MVDVLKLDEPLTELVEIESHVVSTRCACLYRALSKVDGTAVSLWESRARISEQFEKEFLKRLAQIAALRLPNCPLKAYGIDSERRGFAIIGEIEANFLISGYSSKVDSREAERRFTACLQTVSKLHQTGVVLGDLCNHSFVLDRSGRVLFVGILGDLPIDSYKEDLLSELDSISPELFQYMAPEQREGQLATQQSDVFALGVLGYRLFSGQYPFNRIAKEQYTDKIAYPSEIADIKLDKNQGITAVPGWCNEVFKKAVHVSDLVRFKDALDLSNYISSLRQQAISQAQLPADHRAALELTSKYSKNQEGARKFVSPKLGGKQDKQKEKHTNKNKFIFIILIGTFLAICLGLLTGKALFVGEDLLVENEQKNTKPKIASKNNVKPVNNVNTYRKNLKLLIEGLDSEASLPAAEVLMQEGADVNTVRESLTSLLKTKDIISSRIVVATAVEHPDKQVSNLARAEIVNNYRQAGYSRSAEQISQWLSENRDLDAVEAVLSFANSDLDFQEREALLRRAYPADPAAVIVLAAATALDSNKPEDYQPILSQLIGDILSEKESANFSAIALMLAEPQTAGLYADDLLSHKGQIKESDLIWLIKILSKREDLNLRAIAEIGLERLNLQGWKKEFLKILTQKEDLPVGVVLALTNSAISQVTEADIGHLGSWVDSLSQQALMAICTENLQPEILLKAFDTLAAKPIEDINVFNLLQHIRNKYWEDRAKLAILVPAVAGDSEINSELNVKIIDLLPAYVEDSQLLKSILRSKNFNLQKLLLDKYGEKVDLIVLLELLGSNERELRIGAVKALTGHNDAISLNLIKEKYKKEKDPEIIELYKTTFWMLVE